ncbi:MAG: hypothetical protein GY941_21830 [Planctomycetes bacterium]|nr:hypothetical protein [Planctomycetota bacterium]
MSYRDLCHTMDSGGRAGTGYWATVSVLVFLCGLISAMILMQGCGRTLKATVRGAYDVTRAVALDSGEALYRTGQQMQNGDHVSQGGSMPDDDLPTDGTLPESGLGSMASDGQVVSMDQVRAIASEHGIDIGIGN